MKRQRNHKILASNFTDAQELFTDAQKLVKNIKNGKDINTSMNELTALLKNNPLLTTMTTKNRKNLLIKALDESSHSPENLVRVHSSGLLQLLLENGINPLVEDQDGLNALNILEKNLYNPPINLSDCKYGASNSLDNAAMNNLILLCQYYPKHSKVWDLLKSSAQAVSGIVTPLDMALTIRMIASATTLCQDTVGITASYLSISAVKHAGLSCALALSEKYFSIKKQSIFSSSEESLNHIVELSRETTWEKINDKISEIEASSCETLKRALVSSPHA